MVCGCGTVRGNGISTNPGPVDINNEPINPDKNYIPDSAAPMSKDSSFNGFVIVLGISSALAAIFK